MSNKTEFNGGFIQLAFYFLSINGLVAIALSLSQVKIGSQATLILFALINITYLGSISSKPFKIIIDQDKLVVEIHYLHSRLKKNKIFPLHEIECSFNYEIRARGGKARVLKIKYRNESVMELLSGYNGWDEKTLTQIFEKMNSLKELQQPPNNKS